jgi:glycosyltransferase involved in cell wall biosynthesis
VYFYTGTYPASYTLNFIEAFMTGIPIVAIGERLGNSPFELGQKTYEIPDIITQATDGFYSDDPAELRGVIQRLLDDESLARFISKNARKRAIELFGKDRIKLLWKEYLNV